MLTAQAQPEAPVPKGVYIHTMLIMHMINITVLCDVLCPGRCPRHARHIDTTYVIAHKPFSTRAFPFY
jgi:hypothetical protein